MQAMTQRRTAAAVMVALVFHTLADVLLWQRIFERNGLYDYASAYAAGWESMLVGVIAVGAVLLWDDATAILTYALAVYTLAFSGLEDILYYVLDGRAIPAVLPWLDENRLMLFKPVTQSSLIASAAAWVLVWVIVFAMLDKTQNKGREHNEQHS